MNIEFCCRADWLKRNGFQKPGCGGADLLWGEDRHWAEKKVGGDRSPISSSSSSPPLSFSSKLFSPSKLQISPRFCMKRIKPTHQLNWCPHHYQEHHNNKNHQGSVWRESSRFKAERDEKKEQSASSTPRWSISLLWWSHYDCILYIFRIKHEYFFYIENYTFWRRRGIN